MMELISIIFEYGMPVVVVLMVGLFMYIIHYLGIYRGKRLSDKLYKKDYQLLKQEVDSLQKSMLERL